MDFNFQALKFIVVPSFSAKFPIIGKKLNVDTFVFLHDLKVHLLLGCLLS